MRISDWSSDVCSSDLLGEFKGATVADLFGDDRYFADADAFWTAQNEAIAARRAAYLEEGWSDVVIVPASDHFHNWEYEKAAKRKGGRVYVDVRSTGEVRSEEHTSELQSLMRISYAVFCLKKKTHNPN